MGFREITPHSGSANLRCGAALDRDLARTRSDVSGPFYNPTKVGRLTLPQNEAADFLYPDTLLSKLA